MKDFALKGEYFLGWLIITIPSSVVLALNGYLGSFTKLMADDYCSAYIVRRLGFARSIWYWYRNWSGGYSTSIADSLLNIIGASRMYYLVPVFLLVWLIVTILAVAQLLPTNLGRSKRVFTSIALGSFALYSILLLSPNIPQSLHWWGGMRAYSFPLMLITLYLSVYQIFILKIRNTTCLWLGYVISFFFIFLNSGFSETFTPLQLVLFIELIILGLWTGYLKYPTPEFNFLLAGLLGAVLGLIVMVASPGNVIRQANFPPAQNLLGILDISVVGYFGFLKNILGNPTKLAGILSVVLGTTWAGWQNNDHLTVRLWMVIGIFLNGFIIAFGCFPPSAYGMSDVPPGRTLIIAVFFLVASCMLGGYMLGSWLTQRRANYPVILRRGLLVITSFLIVVTAWNSGINFFASIPVHIEYASKWDDMELLIASALRSGQTDVHIPAKLNWAQLNEPNDNPKFWVTFCMSKYYGIQVLAPSADVGSQ